jgi:diadenosine tetraphosphate (Ap4A) HIT family hydrolase
MLSDCIRDEVMYPVSMEDCIFCKIVSGDSPSHKVWEDEQYLAFLSIFPNTDGVTVVIPKKHYPSYVFELPESVFQELLSATKKVALLIDAAFEDVGRSALVFEGFGVDHVHAKLFPMHGTANMETWRPIESSVPKFFTQYEGYISSHDYERADDSQLEALAEKIRNHVT